MSGYARVKTVAPHQPTLHLPGGLIPVLAYLMTTPLHVLVNDHSLTCILRRELARSEGPRH